MKEIDKDLISPSSFKEGDIIYEKYLNEKVYWLILKVYKNEESFDLYILNRNIISRKYYKQDINEFFDFPSEFFLISQDD